MKVSVVVVTYNRERFMPALYHVYARQTYPHTELLVLDDSDQPSPFFTRLQDPRVRYTHLRQRMSIGAKRNRLIAQAEGEWICHFDDDDYYADDYIERMLGHSEGVAFVKLSAWFNLSVGPRILTYWDTSKVENSAFRQGGDGLQFVQIPRERQAEHRQRNLLGYGFSYFHRKSVASAHPFADVSFGGDLPVVQGFLQAGGALRVLPDDTGMVLHRLHGSNVSAVFPQYRLPHFMVERLFPHYPAYEGHLE